MPTFRIVSAPDPAARHRDPRGAALRQDDQRLMTVLDARSLAEAAVDARDTAPHRERRITSVEEIHPGFCHPDAEISRVLAQVEDPDGLEGRTTPLCDDIDFVDFVQRVIGALRDSDLVPGLSISVLANDPDECYAMIEVFDDIRGVYLARGTEVRRLIEDRDAVGWDGVISIARGVIAFSNDLH